MKTGVYLALLFLTFSLNAKNISTHTVSRDDGTNVSYYLLRSLPQSQSDTLLLILQGSDCNSVLKIETIFTDYQNVWPEADVLLIEKYGIDSALTYSEDAERKDCPAQYIQNDSPDQRVADVMKVLDFIRKKNKYSNLVVLGGSEGAIIANLVSATIDGITATISFNGGGRKFIDDVTHNISATAANSIEAEASIIGFKEFSNHILNNKPDKLEVSGHGYKWWQQMLSIDQFDVLKKVNTPLLILQGGGDLSVSPDKVDEMITNLREIKKQNIEYRRYEALDHGFANINGESMREKIVSDINNWLKSKLVNPNKSVQPTANASTD
ncbi:alpha/beta hydrolase [Pseudoalteromonas sp. S4498]|uniref:alpha/beta hydrolase family protein n=1 Tax=Pseudoalteromonas galatheae TaxID=579562 RepID=UPI001109FC4D|nr:acyl-CoA thioester hydrolase/BAAT C-terminal domain-containing protein [Pseudoalteromonas galatheae]NKC18742.1 alpha/beta hydrolase [Pseudoalteromonas galatheae]